MTRVTTWSKAALGGRFESWLPMVVGITGVVAFYQLPTPINVSQQPLLEVFTTNKVVVYVSMLALVAPWLWRGRPPLLDVPGLWTLAAALLLMIASTIVAENPWRSVGYFNTNVATFLLYACTSIYLFSVKRVEYFLRALVYVGAALLVLSRLHVLTLDRLLPQTDTARRLIANIAAETTSTAIAGAGTRLDMLWFDANGTGYIAAGLALICVYLLLSRRRSWPSFVVHWGLLLLFLVTLVGTLSRGASVALLVACLPLALSFAMSTERRRFLIGVGAGILAGLAVGGFLLNDFSVLGQRLLNAAHAMGFGPGNTTGLEYGRQDTQRLAWEEFLQRPILGWGGRQMGRGVHATSNHLFYLDWLGNWGIIGFAIFLLFCGYLFRSTATIVRWAWSARNVELHLVLTLVALLALMAVKGLFAPLTYDFWLYAGLATGLARSTFRSVHGAPAEWEPTPKQSGLEPAP